MSLQEEESKIAEGIFGWTGSALALFFYIVPVIPVIKLVKKQLLVKEFPGILLMCSFLNCILWCVYGWRQDKLQVWVANGTGGIITLIWIVFYLVYFAELKLIPSIVYNFILFNFVFEIGFFCFYINIKDIEVIGYIAMAFNILMYAAPGEKMYTVIKTMNKDLLPIYSSIAGVACSTCWFMYGVYISTMSMIIPNGLGILCSILQIGVWLFVHLKTKNTQIPAIVDANVDETQTTEPKGADPDPLFHSNGN